MKTAVVGAGAMGMLFGSRLAAAGHEVTMIDVVPAVLEELGTNGISITDAEGEHVIPVKACRGEELKEEQDLVILFTKTLYSRSALEASGGYIGEKTMVLTLQNGLGNVELINEYVKLEQILVGVTNYNSDITGTGRIRTEGSGYVRLMSADCVMRDEVQTVNDMLAGAGFASEIRPDVYAAVWEKVGFNAAVNATTALCHCPVGGVGSVEEGRKIAFAIAEETARTAQAHGVMVEADAIRHSLEFAFENHKGHFTSMAQDVLHKRPTEADFINGQIVKKAHEKGLQVPYVEAVYLLLKVVQGTYPIQNI